MEENEAIPIQTFSEYLISLLNYPAIACAVVGCFAVGLRILHDRKEDDHLLHVLAELFYISVIIYGLHPLGKEFGLKQGTMIAISALIGFIGITRLSHFLVGKLTVQLWNLFLNSYELFIINLSKKVEQIVKGTFGETVKPPEPEPKLPTEEQIKESKKNLEDFKKKASKEVDKNNQQELKEDTKDDTTNPKL